MGFYLIHRLIGQATRPVEILLTLLGDLLQGQLGPAGIKLCAILGQLMCHFREADDGQNLPCSHMIADIRPNAVT
jgi:hypothetical protein